MGGRVKAIWTNYKPKLNCYMMAFLTATHCKIPLFANPPLYIAKTVEPIMQFKFANYLGGHKYNSNVWQEYKISSWSTSCEATQLSEAKTVHTRKRFKDFEGRASVSYLATALFVEYPKLHCNTQLVSWTLIYTFWSSLYLTFPLSLSASHPSLTYPASSSYHPISFCPSIPSVLFPSIPFPLIPLLPSINHAILFLSLPLTLSPFFSSISLQLPLNPSPPSLSAPLPPVPPSAQ